MIRLLLLLFFLLSMPNFSYSGEVPRRAQRAYQSALRRAAERKWDKAEQCILVAIKRYRPYTDAYVTYGGWLMARHQYAAAAEILKQGASVCKDGQKIFAKPLAASMLYSGDVLGARKLIPQNSKDSFWRKLQGQAMFMQNALLAAETIEISPVGPLWGINTPFPELFPTLSGDGQTLYFTRRMNGIDEDFFFAKPDTCGGWQSARNMGSPPNTLQQEAAQFISADGHYLFFMRCDNRTLSGWDQGGCDLYMAYTADSVWSAPQSFGGTINTPGFEGMPCLSSDNRELYFVSNRDSGYGGLDIWSSRFEHGLWQPPRNLGPGINTPGDETSPFIYADNATLYFASTGRPGVGGSDLYMSRRKDDWTWSEAIHLGMPINTPFDEASLSLNAAGDTAYFSSDRDSVAGNFDLYQCPLPERYQPGLVMYMKGVIYDSLTHEPLNFAQLYVTDSTTGRDLYQVQSNRGDGSYTVALPVGHTYLFYADRIQYQNVFDTMHINPAFAGLTIPRNYALLPDGYVAPTKDSLVATIYFVKNSVDIGEFDKQMIEAAMAPWQNMPGVLVLVNGYTDNTGTPLLNEQLSFQRARLVSAVFNKHFDPDAIQTQGWGEANAVAENDTDEHRDMNRRVEIVIRK
jgi:outer membrane protein OmpA-like peptidoglycan-associated protein